MVMSRSATALVIGSIRSASVDLPWSVCAMMEMMEKWRILSYGCGGVARDELNRCREHVLLKARQRRVLRP